MKFKFQLTCLLTAFASAALFGASAQAQTNVLSIGHTDLSLDYNSTNNVWNLHVGSDTFGTEYEATNVILHVKALARTPIPADPKFSFLGAPGTIVWLLPQTQNEDLLYLGYGGDGIPAGVFVNDQVTVTLRSVDGPGDFFSYKTDTFGNPVVYFNTKDGITTNDSVTVQAGGDAHLNWAFTSPGVYTVGLEASGTLVAGNKPTSSGPVYYTFSVTEPTVWSTGHTDLSLEYVSTNDTWNLHAGQDATGQELAASEVVLKVKSEAKTTGPADPKFSFLGAAGSAIWLLPQTQNEDLLYLGYGGDGIPDGVFVGNQVNVTLKSVTGPGDFFSYKTDTFGNPVVYFNTKDGISTNDFVTVQAGGDAHLNWAFTAPGDYTVVLQASGTLVAGNKLTTSAPVAYSFTVAPDQTILSTGHTDLSLNYDSVADMWDLHVGQDATMQEWPAEDVILQVKPEAKTTVPSDAKFAFLGNPGDPIWLLPQTQATNLLYLGFGGDGIPAGVFAGDQVTVSLQSVTGPGNFFAYKTDTFGNPVVYFNTQAGISTNDVVAVQAGGDNHLNWAFTAAGDYTVVLQASGRLANSTNVTTSLPVAYTFQVLPVVVDLTNEHVDLRALYDPTVMTNQLTIVARDEDHLINYQSNEVHLVVEEAAKIPLPAGTPFGNAGDPLWIIPQSQDPTLLYLGLSTETIPANTFSSDLNFQLKALDGPGNMYVWQADSTGNLHIYYNTADGISDADSHPSIVGSHEHFNWGFTTNGTYHVTLQVSGQLIGGATASSPLTTFTFQVLPLPTNAPPSNVQLGSPQVVSTGFSFTITGAANHSCDVQSSPDLLTWTTVMTVVPVSSPQTITIPPDPGEPRRFVRVIAH